MHYTRIPHPPGTHEDVQEGKGRCDGSPFLRPRAHARAIERRGGHRALQGESGHNPPVGQDL